MLHVTRHGSDAPGRRFASAHALQGGDRMRARKRVRSLSRQSGRMLLALPCVVLSLGRAPVVAGGLRPAQRQVCAPGNLVAIKQAFVRGMKEKDLKVLELYAPDAVFTNPDR